ncbi:uncharacterized protein YukE [Streptomyces olivoverticillatus]|uniref:Uncharacterized protein YukE n=1 Tax=Streptomyces olivoverticillatus TaxID=66427 RepID=A0A7W7PIL2_9ACTN|nr:hypothetical protein [Streptomyces olivoverticillatus]MBB4892146.1 uncharacterized protein YukE [Streptomyces olivoverticillatus]
MTGPLMKGPEPHHSPVDPRRPVSFSAVAPDFTGYSHQELEAMVEHADPARVSTVAEKLKGAAKDIKDVGEDLKKYIAHVPWEGEGGDAFRNWGADMANATLKLGDCSEAAGKWMHEAASMLDHAQRAMPKYSTSAKSTLNAYLSHHPQPLGMVPDPLTANGDGGLQGAGPTQAQAFAAQQRLHDDHMQAAQQIGNLVQAYGHSEHQIWAVERPNFPVIPVKFMPERRATDDRQYEPMPGAAGGSQGNEGSAVTMPQGGAPSGGGVGSATPAISPLGVAPSVPPVATGIDGGVAVPTAPPVPSTGTVPPSGASLPSPPASQPPGVVIPPTIGVGPGTSGVPAGGSRLPSGARPPVRQGRGSVGGLPLPHLPDASRDGIAGGRPVPRETGTPSAGAPRGSIFGAEPGETQGQGRPPMSPGGGFAAAPGAPAGSRSVTSGRRLATQPGGVIGGQGTSRPGAQGDRPFTPGGTGLVRGGRPGEGSGSSAVGNQAGLTPHALGSGGPQPRGRRAGQRPDYLMEDEETWTQGSRRVSPPVID